MLTENEEVLAVAVLIICSIVIFCVIAFLRNKRRGRLREKVRTLLPKLYLAKQEYLRLTDFDNYDEMPNRPFSKLTKDVFEELGLTYVK